MAILFAATHPNRTSSLVLADAWARRSRAQDYPCGIPEETIPKYIKHIVEMWGTGQAAVLGAPSLAHNQSFIELRGRLERLAMSPAQFADLNPTRYEIDVRPLLETIRVPTLVLHRKDNPYIRVGNGRYLAEHIEGASSTRCRNS